MVRHAGAFAQRALEAQPSLRRAFREDVLRGLARSPKRIPAKYLYDEAGSALFERISNLDEYYLTRTENAIFKEHGQDIAQAIGPGAAIIEPGAGTGVKAAQLLALLKKPQAYVPIEMSRAALRQALERIHRAFPHVDIDPIAMDFTKLDIELSFEQAARAVVFFPGSTIGNFDPHERRHIWYQFAQLVGPGGMVLIGFDLVKDVSTILAAYDDEQGLSAAFNTNLLHRVNRELGGDFDVHRFAYCVKWNVAIEAIEMTQRSNAEQVVHVAGEHFSFRQGEHLRIERSYKFHVEQIDEEAAQASFVRRSLWIDPRGWFGVGLYQV